MPRKRRFYLKEDLKFDNSSKLNYCNFVRTRRNSSLQCTFLYSVSLRFQSHLSHWTLAIKWWIRTDSWWHEDTNWDSIISLKNDFSKKKYSKKMHYSRLSIKLDKILCVCVCVFVCVCACVCVSPSPFQTCTSISNKNTHPYLRKTDMRMFGGKKQWGSE